MTDIATLALNVTSATAVKGASDLDRLTAAASRAEDQVQDLGAASRGLSGPLGAVGKNSITAGNGARMLAQQLSQVGQQTMATGNFVQALAIQLPDIGLAFGAIGAAAGLLSAIALPALMSAFTGTKDNAQELKDTLDAMDDAVAAYAKSADAALQTNAELRESYGRLTPVVQEALAAIASVDQVAAINAVATAIQAVSDNLLTVYATQGGGRAGGSRVGLVDDFGMAADAAQELVDALKALQAAKGLEAQAVAAASVVRLLEQAYGNAEAMPEPLRNAYAEMGRIVAQAGSAVATTDRLRMSTFSIVEAANAAAAAVGGIGAAAGGAIGQVQALATAMWNAAQARAAALQSVDTMNLAGQYASYGQGRKAGETAASESRYALPVMAGAGGGGGGGGGLADDFAQRLQELQEGLQTERETLDLWYQEAQTILNDRRAQELLGEREHRAAILQVEEQYQAQLAEIQAAAQQQRIGDTASFFGALASIAQSGGKRMAKAVATFQAIEGVVNAYGAAIKALNTPGITLTGRFAAYASVLAAGLKGVAAIKAAGGVSGGVPGGGGRPASQGPRGGNDNASLTIYGIDRDKIYSGAMLEQIFDGLVKIGKLRQVRFIN